VSTRAFWAGTLGGIVAFAACDEAEVHIYSGQKFDPKGHCVDAPVSIDVINGGSTTYGCAPECLVATDPCGNPYIFVSTQCGPYPQGVVTQSEGTTGDASDQCGPAFAAIADGGLCETGSADAGDAMAGDAMMGCD
jgi:hypothetical protein